MASSEYTPNLNLSAWTASDRPKRADFVSDNRIIDTALGGHIANSTAHMTADEKSRVSEPYVLRLYAGNGASSRSIDLGFQAKLVIVYKRTAAPVLFDGSITVVNSAVAASGYSNTAGLSLNSTGFSVSQTAAVDGIKINLNENGSQYTVIAFK